MNATFEIPVKIVSEMNWRGHYYARSRRLKEQKGITYAHCLKHLGCKPTDDALPGNFHITLTRLLGYRQRNYDGDNLQVAFKAVRDGIAMYLGIDDGSDRLAWTYRQERGTVREGVWKPGVRVEIKNHDV